MASKTGWSSPGGWPPVWQQNRTAEIEFRSKRVVKKKSYTHSFQLSILFTTLRSLILCMFLMRMCCAPFLQSFSLQQYGVSSGRASIGSCTSLPPTQVFTTIGIYKGERVAIKKISKKKVSGEGNIAFWYQKYCFLV